MFLVFCKEPWNSEIYLLYKHIKICNSQQRLKEHKQCLKDYKKQLLIEFFQIFLCKIVLDLHSTSLRESTAVGRFSPSSTLSIGKDSVRDRTIAKAKAKMIKDLIFKVFKFCKQKYVSFNLIGTYERIQNFLTKRASILKRHSFFFTVPKKQIHLMEVYV